MKKVKALVFDTFGTVVDWRGSVTRMGERLAVAKGIEGIDWDAFARSWCAGYRPGMAPVISGERPWTPIDVIHREILEVILVTFGISDKFTDGEKSDFNLMWHRLDPWPDCVPGLLRLRRSHIIAPLSNGATQLLVNLAKRAGIPWDLILSSDVTRAYKRDPRAYQGAIAALGMQPHEVMMCAAHNDDLDAAREQGMRTAYINRPYEYGPDQTNDFEATSDWDVITDHIGGIADDFGH
jgi:2-haloacid dehalogenase